MTEVPQVTGHERRVVCQRDAGNQEVGAADALQAIDLHEASQLPRGRFIEGHDHQPGHLLFTPVQALLCPERLFGGLALEQVLTTPPQDLGLHGRRDPELRFACLSHVPDDCLVPVPEVQQGVGVEEEQLRHLLGRGLAPVASDGFP